MPELIEPRNAADHIHAIYRSQTNGKIPIIVQNSSLEIWYLAQAQGTPCKSATVALL